MIPIGSKVRLSEKGRDRLENYKWDPHDCFGVLFENNSVFPEDMPYMVKWSCQLLLPR